MIQSISKCLAVAFLLGVAVTADAGLIIEVQDANITAGGSGFVDVLIRSDGIDLLDAANYEFAITPIGGAATTLDFSDPQDYSEEFDPSYVFFGDSLGLFTNVQAPGMIEMSDATFTGIGTIVTPDDRLLVRLDVEHTGVPAGASDQFSISLVGGQGTMFLDPLFTEIGYESGPGTVTVTGASVPEPSALLFGAMTALPLVIRRRRR